VAIFGNLTEFPFLEVISMLQNRNGVLYFSNLRPYESMELQLQAGQLQGLTVDGVPIFDAQIARSYLSEIASKRSGDFEFKKSHDVSHRQVSLKIVVADALLKTGATSDLFQVPEAQLPDPQTRFTPVAAEVSHLADELKAFWVRAQPLVLRGSSAAQVASELRLELSDVQLAFYQLRTIGAIRPARRIEETMPIKPQAIPTPTQPASPTSAKPSLVSRLLGALSLMRRAS
jgi:hypothetical protein